MKSLKTAVFFIASALSASVFAGPVYEYSITNPVGSANAGDVKQIDTTYDEGSQDFSWSYTIGRDSAGLFSDGFWLVVTDGENPKNDANEYAILYGDVDGDRISAYEYSGQNNANSFNNPGNLLDTFTGIFNTSIDDNGTIGTADDTRTISFSIDASTINAGNENTPEGMWKGLNFDTKIGIWFHPSTGSTFTYSAETGLMTTFSYTRQGWHDSSNQDTTVQVPEPSFMLLLALALLALGLHTRNSSQGLTARPQESIVAA